MTRIVYIPREIKYQHLQRIKLVVVFNYIRSPSNIEYEFSVERHRTSYLFLLNLITLRQKIDAKYFTIKLNGWNEVYNLREKIPDKRFLSIYFITNTRFKLCNE